MRLIDADALKAWVEEQEETKWGLSTDAVWDAIDDAQTIEAVPVVRCKDCMHRPIDTGGRNYGQDLFFPNEDNVCPCQCGDQWYSWMPPDDWFCANGERSEE